MTQKKVRKMAESNKTNVKKSECNKLIEFNHVSIGYDNAVISRDVNFDICEGDFVGIIGPNGAGKTTLLKTIISFLKPLRGKVWYNPSVFTKTLTRKNVSRFIGFVPQRVYTDQKMPFFVIDVVMMGLYSTKGLFGKITKQDIERVKRVMKEVNVAHLWNVPFGHLSGGQKQRVLVARALLKDPTLLLFDEPTSALDIKGKKEVINVIGKVSKKKTIVVVTHSINELYPYVNKVIYIMKNEFFVGSPEDVITRDRLKNIYGTDVDIVNVKNHLCILTEDDHHDFLV